MKIKAINNYMSASFLVLAVFTIISALSAVHYHNAQIYMMNLQYQSLIFANQLAAGSNRLTDDVRAFSVTGDAAYDEDYVKEVNVEHLRDKAVENLRQLGTPETELNFIEDAKRNSDSLIDLENRAFEAGRNGNLELARELVYGQDYKNAKAKIMEPIFRFNQKMEQRLTRGVTQANSLANTSMSIMLATLILNIIAILISILRLEEQKVKMETQQFELKDTQAWFSGIIKSAPDAMLVINEKGAIVLCNPKAEEIFGYESGELNWKTVDELVPAEIRAAHPAMRAKFMAGGSRTIGKNYFDVRGIRKDGSSFPIELSLSLLPDLSKQGICACASVRDITIARQVADEICAANAKVKEMHNQTRSSIEYSAIIQQSILPVSHKLSSAFPDSFSHWQPKDIVGGDIWFFEQTRRDGEFLLFVIDCTGHGVPGAFVTMLVKSIQHSIMMECRITRKEIHPSELLAIFNREIKHLLDQHIQESESNVGFDGGIVYFDLNRRGIIRYAGAETPLFLIDKEGKCKTIKGSRHSVGYRSCNENYIYEEHEFSIDSFDGLYLTTDGLLDQNGGAKDIPFGKRKLISILESNYHKPIGEIKELVMNDVAEWQGNAEQNDDITFVGIKFNDLISLNNLHNENYMKEHRHRTDRRRKLVNVDEVKELVKKDGIVFLTYGGFLSQTLITCFADAIEKEAEKNNVGIGDSSNILTIFIELAQNILNYSKTKEVGSEETRAEGMIIVGKSEIETGQQQYYIISQNIVALSDKEKMLPKFADIEALDKEGLKKRYRELRKSSKDAHEKGGGIGFYEIAKRSDRIEHEFIKLNEDKFHFRFKAFVSIKSTTE